MNTIIQQQLEEHYGDEYKTVVQQATRFCKAVVAKPWWGENRAMLINNEGGIPGMRLSALVSIVEKEDITAGLKAYGRYLRSEYAADSQHLSLEALEIDLYVNKTDHLDSLMESDLDRTESFDLQSLYGLLEKMNLSPGEREFFQTYSSVRDVQETSALCGMTMDDGFRVYDRVKHRASYLVKAQAT